MATEAPTQPLYVYGVVAGGEPPPGTGIAGAPVSAIAADGVAAIVSELPQLDRVALGREELSAHAAVLEQALQSGPVLPMRFGVVLDGEDTVRNELLQSHHEDLRRQLQEVTGKVELRVRATYEEQTLMREVVSENAEIIRLRESIQGLPDEATYYDRIRLGELVADAVNRKREADAAELLAALTPHAVETRTSEPNHERVAMTASFLIDEDRMPVFDQAVDELGRAHQGRLRLKYTGPLPPYSFVQLGGEG